MYCIFCMSMLCILIFWTVETHNLHSLHTILSTGSPLKPQSYDYVYRCIKNNVLLGSISGCFFFFFYSDALILSLCSSFVGFLKMYWIALTCKKRKKKSSNTAWTQTKRGWGIERKFSLKTRSCHSDKLRRTLVFPRSPQIYTKTIPFSTLLCWQSKRILSAWLTDALRVHHTRRHEKQQSSCYEGPPPKMHWCIHTHTPALPQWHPSWRMIHKRIHYSENDVSESLINSLFQRYFLDFTVTLKTKAW